MKKWLVLATLCTAALSLSADETPVASEIVEVQSMPQYLYKILSLQSWQESQSSETVLLPSEDGVFIHFATRDQVERVLEKYWADVQQFVVLKVDSSKLDGKMAYEANPGGTAKYFHLYDGCIPVSAVVDFKIVDRDTQAVG